MCCKEMTVYMIIALHEVGTVSEWNIYVMK